LTKIKTQVALVVDDSKTINRVLQSQLDGVNIHSEVAKTLHHAKYLLSSNPERFFVAVLDLNLPDAPSGEVVEYVRKFNIPIIILTGNLNDNVRQKMLNENLVDYVLKRNISEIGYVVQLVNQIYHNPFRKVLVVDDSITTRALIKKLLKVHRYSLLEACDGKQGFKVLKENPDITLIITDYNMPLMNGMEMIEKIRRKYSREDLAIVGMSNLDDKNLSTKLLKAGANDFIFKPFEVEEFYCRIGQNVEMTSKIKQIRDSAVRDFLTGLYNRRYLFEEGKKLFSDAKKGNFQLATAVIDADFFKNINDTYGHEAGDIVLIEISTTLREAISDNGIASRFGGEEFVCLFKHKNKKVVNYLFESIRKKIAALRIPVADNMISVTVSIGVSTKIGDSLENMLKDADERVYQAKDNGRNQVVF